MATTRQPQAAVYARENYLTEPIRMPDGTYPPKLDRLLKRAAKIPRPFDTLFVATAAVLGTPQDAQEIIDKLSQYGVTVNTADGSPIGTGRRASMK